MLASWSIASRFLILGVLCAPLGMLLGIGMAASGNHQLSPVHAHLLLIGWVSFFLQGLYFHVVGVARPRLANTQLALGALGLLIMVPSLALLLTGTKAAEPFTALSSILVLAGALLFAFQVIQDRRKAA